MNCEQGMVIGGWRELRANHSPIPKPGYLYCLQQIRTISTNLFDTFVLLSAQDSAAIIQCMARYSALLGHRIVVTYRAGDIILPATGNLSADSGKSIFLEESYKQKGSIKTFRWEIPYTCILSLDESFAPAPIVPGENAEKLRSSRSSALGALREQIREA